MTKDRDGTSIQKLTEVHITGLKILTSVTFLIFNIYIYIYIYIFFFFIVLLLSFSLMGHRTCQFFKSVHMYFRQFLDESTISVCSHIRGIICDTK
jgi:hypothetical protein